MSCDIRPGVPRIGRTVLDVSAAVGLPDDRGERHLGRKTCNQCVAICDARLRPRDGERTREDTPTSMARARPLRPCAHEGAERRRGVPLLPPLLCTPCCL